MKVNQIALLLEYDRSKTLNNWSDKLSQRGNAEKILTSLEQIDPTPKKIFVVWLVRQFINQQFRLEDGYRVIEVLKNFIKLKNKLKPEERDIGKMDFRTLRDIIDRENNISIDAIPTSQLKFENQSDIEILYNGPYGKLLVPKTEAASCEVGRGTKWCTAATESDNLFNTYNDFGSLYVWIDKSGKKFQFWYPTDESDYEDGCVQIMNDKDDPISKEVFNEFSSHPVLSKLIKKCEEKMYTSLTGQYLSYVVSRYCAMFKGKSAELEPLIMQNPVYALSYASEVIKGRWAELEQIILQTQDSGLAFSYAKRVVNGKWPEAEPLIMQSPGYASLYQMLLREDGLRQNQQ